jgi:type I restriction enzyme S subunit
MEKEHDLPHTWETVQVCDIGIAVTGNTPPTKIKGNYGSYIPFIKPPDLLNCSINTASDYLSELGAKHARIAPPNTVLVSCIGNLGKIGINRTPAAFNQQINAILPLPSIDPYFVFYQAQSAYFRRQLEECSSATTISIVNKGNFANLYLYLAPINEQHRIVAKIEELFSELDKGIESLKIAREQLKVYRQAVLKHAFEGKLTAQWREENKDKLQPADQLLARIQRERESQYQKKLEEWEAGIQEWEETGKPGKKPSKPRSPKAVQQLPDEAKEKLPLIPDSWSWIKLAELFPFSPQNGLYKPSTNYGSGTSIIRIDDFYDGRLVRSSGFKRLRLSDSEIETYRIRNGDLIINRVNSIEYLGKCALVSQIEGDIVFESNIMKCQLVESYICREFITQYLASRDGRSRLCQNAKHAVNQASINQTDVGNTIVPLPPYQEQKEIFDILEQQMSKTDAMLDEIETNLLKSEALRQSILKKAFSGKLVEQDPNDEPAPTLLERIKAEKAKPSKKKKRKTAA